MTTFILFQSGVTHEVPEEYAEEIRKAWVGGETEIKHLDVGKKFYAIKLENIDLIYETEIEIDDVVEDTVEEVLTNMPEEEMYQ